MIKKIILFSLILVNFRAFSAQDINFEPFTENQINRIVDAIGRAENSKKYPYGIVSIKIKGNTQAEKEAYARRICYNTVRNNYKRFNNQDKYNDFIEFLGSRYCPVGAENDPNGLNKNWVKNVKHFLNIKSSK